MKKFFLFLICITFANPIIAKPLEGGVKYDVKSARTYVQEGVPSSFKAQGHLFFNYQSNIEQIVYSNNKKGQTIGITVQYEGEPQTAYIYNEYKKLIYVDKYDKPVKIFPHRGYRYTLDGKLYLMSLSVSKTEHYRFSPDGKLIAHSKDGIIYDEKGNVIGFAN